MRKSICLIALSSTLFACSSKTTNFGSEEKSGMAHGMVQLGEVEGYFSSLKPAQDTVLILNKSSFSRNFHPARTMGSPLTDINFDTRKTAAIVLPETVFETDIRIDSTYVHEKTLHIVYSVKQSPEKRSFTTIPSKAFTFDAKLDVQAVSFEKAGKATKIEL
ncbi:hypothetical protein [Pedobacter nutrimenti]|jgi:hypothetical protein|uniref:Lipoprotein n=1 Tax=Pedobacter nutrimenti TaxID=1241337 RepID=A0A318UF28_9SPHI|nr:hypothetical protein [Pedobacter nutrimenti]PYF75002.1 hypothetical protein B0O44_103448 [Pedobacter nutrimenti]|eukprot:gene11858-13821_t